MRTSLLDADPTTSIRPRRFRVLLIDEDPDRFVSLSVLLRLDRHKVVGVHDAHDTVKLALESHPDMVIIEMGPSREKWLAVGRSLRKLPQLDGVTMIAFSDSPAENPRPFDYDLTMPADPEMILELLDSLA